MSSSKTVRLDDIMDVMVEKLNSGGIVTFTPNGTSMLPMLRDGEDVVVLKSVQGKRLHLFDVPLYRRDNGQYVLHRVIDFTRDGSYVMCGDNQFAKEKGIRDGQIIAVMPGFSARESRTRRSPYCTAPTSISGTTPDPSGALTASAGERRQG